jgi:very-short-patch-repair endonuclease
MTRRGIRDNIDSGTLFHARRDHYVDGTASDAIKSAVRIGGHLDCISLMRELGVFVLMHTAALHVHIPHGRHWLRSPRSRSTRLGESNARIVTHWRADPVDEHSTIAHLPRAVAQAVLCQTPRAAIATIDSALHLGVIRPGDLDEVFECLPERLQKLRKLVDGRAESGPETLARLLLRALGCSIELQVEISGVGRVDLLVDGWIIVECDSRAFHGGWDQQSKDRMRDLAAAAQGYATLRPTANQLVNNPRRLTDAVRGLRTLHLAVHNDAHSRAGRERNRFSP